MPESDGNQRPRAVHVPKSVLHVSGKMPGALFLTPPDATNTSVKTPLLSALLGAVSMSPPPDLQSIPAGELDATLESMRNTVRRAHYHLERFSLFRNELDARRKFAPGDVFYDALTDYMHYELQAFGGAARASLDLLVYLIARRHGASTDEAHSPRKWDTYRLINGDAVSERHALPEIAALRRHADWFEWLNAYRNAAFHHGWTSGKGHFDNDARVRAASTPKMNALLVPDRDSLRRRKPNEWSYEDNDTVDTLAVAFAEGLEKSFRSVLTGIWKVEQPAPGSVPEKKHPTMICSLSRPGYLEVRGELCMALFNTREAAEAFMKGRPALRDLELCLLPAVALEGGKKGIAFTTTGLAKRLPQEQDRFLVMIDPQPLLQADGSIPVADAFELDIEGLRTDPFQVLTVPVTAETEHLWMWRLPFIRE